MIEDSLGNDSVSFLQIDSSQKGVINVQYFGIKNSFLIIIPSISSKNSDFSNYEPSYRFSWKVTTTDSAKEDESKLINSLLLQIENLKQEISRVQAQLDAMKNGNNPAVCGRIETDLFLGIRNSKEVKCLQLFLKSQGAEIYPEAIVSGNFLTLTKIAVIRFQEKYASEILVPSGLDKGTGFVGLKTRSKINQLLGS